MICLGKTQEPFLSLGQESGWIKWRWISGGGYGLIARYPKSPALFPKWYAKYTLLTNHSPRGILDP